MTNIPSGLVSSSAQIPTASYALTASYAMNGGGGGAGRELLTANRTYYVDPAGSDSNDGLTTSSAFLTIQKGVDVACTVDLGIYNVTIKLADGTYSAGATLSTYVGAGAITISGNTTSPASCSVALTGSGTTGGNCFYAIDGIWTVTGVKVSTSAAGGNGLRVNGPSILNVGVVDFGPCTNNQMLAIYSGRMQLQTSYTISSGSACHVLADRLGLVNYPSGITVTINNTPNFTSRFAYCTIGALVYAAGVTFTGSATGKRYEAMGNATIFTNSGGTYFPGNVAGVASEGGRYF